MFKGKRHNYVQKSFEIPSPEASSSPHELYIKPRSKGWAGWLIYHKRSLPTFQFY
ncbi:hypothetical protein L0F63_002837, partial [Massospora cicadina]